MEYTPDQHYGEAEELIADAHRLKQLQASDEEVTYRLRLAQVHATLATVRPTLI